MISFCILGWLKIKPMTGYELSKQIIESIGEFWGVKQSQIYQELKKLEVKKLVTYKLVKQDNKPNKRIFFISEEGKKYFDESKAINGNDIDGFLSIKLLYLVRVFFGSFKSVDQNVEFLTGLKEKMTIKIKTLESKKNLILDENFEDHVNGKIYFLATINYGIHSYQFSIQWIDDLITQLLKTKK